ncbi:MAG: hypothetical protein HKN79_11405 [Flavobacteriales bacterium]|nr:hypothetical protein [Flavobacteriales bacterium]
MEILGQILIGTVPALVVLFAAYFLFKYQLEALFERLNRGSATAEKFKVHVNFQAYERLVLYLERINPSNMVLRMYKNANSAKSLESDMVRAIREEFEHNLSQQIYVSDEIWKLIRQAKDETIKLISLASGQCSENSSANELSRILLELAGSIDEFPHDVAIRYLKQELRSKL